MDDLNKTLTLSFLKGIGLKKIIRILQTKEDLEKIADNHEFLQKIGVQPQEFAKWNSEDVEEKVAKEIALFKTKKIKTMCFSDKAYPKLLGQIFDAPPLFSYYGEIPNDEYFFIAIVGSRHASNYGRRQTRRIIEEIAKNYEKIVIVSGLAYGIDSTAHQVALDLGIKTIAVLGSGLGVIYPKVHQSLAASIIEQKGAVLSEFYTMTPPTPHNFPFRNRIISGLSLVVLLMESAIKSGALITARCALEQNRDVFVLPGNVDSPSYQGNNLLLKQGANILLAGRDVLEHFTLQKMIPYIQSTQKKKISPTPIQYTEKENIVLEAIKKNPSTLEEIANETGLDIIDVMQIISRLELQEAIHEELGGTYFITT